MPRKAQPINGILPCGAKSIRLCGCTQCKAYEAESHKARRLRKASKGLCEVCGLLDCLPFSVRCAVCYLKNSFGHSKRRKGRVNLCSLCDMPFHNASNCKDYEVIVKEAKEHGFDYEAAMMELRGDNTTVKQAMRWR